MTTEKTHYRNGVKLCECGCGNPAPISKRTVRSRGQVRGGPVRFIRGHHNKLKPRGKESPKWKGGVAIDSNGYIRVQSPDHPHCDNGGFVAQHRLIAEKAMGKVMPITAEVHHVDSDKGNNKNNNLVVCQDRAYHFLLHQRERAFNACGHADWRSCNYCKKHDAPENLVIRVIGRETGVYHKKCRNEHRRSNKK